MPIPDPGSRRRHLPMKRKESIIAGTIYHVCNKSIANYGIFQLDQNKLRFLSILEYYNNLDNTSKYSDFLKTNPLQYSNLLIKPPHRNVSFIAYCIMVDHYHLLLKTANDRLSNYLGQVENSYSHYFNIKYNRKGPLWQSRFRLVQIRTNEQLLHTCRYVHINPTTSKLVTKPENWKYSSYNDYINGEALKTIKEISIENPKHYKSFCEDRIDYQQTLKNIKSLLLE